jgi:RNA 3'-phosphate cyclase
MTQMIQIDGSFGEGGGALVRTALACSLLTKRPFSVNNIRSKRPNPGLKAQHLEAIKAIKQLAPKTKTSHIELGTTEFWFHPGAIKSGQYRFDIKTAGSIGLFLQAILPPCLFAPSKVTITIKGGTCGKWQASVDYLQRILLPSLQRFTSKLTLSITKRGYFPKGGGEAILEISPKYKLKDFNNVQSLISEIQKETTKIEYINQGKLECIKGFVNASKDLSDIQVARRIESASSTSCRSLNVPISIDKGYFPSLSTGGEFLIWTVHSQEGKINPTNCVRLAASILIEKNLSSEQIGQTVAKNLKKIISSNAGVDHFLADQLLIYMALIQGSSIKTTQVTNHSITNIHIIEQFIPIRFLINEKENTILSKVANKLRNVQTTLNPDTKIQNETKTVKIGNWNRLSSKHIHTGQIFETFVDQVISPNGKRGEYSYIKVLNGVCVLPIDKYDNIYLIKEYRYPIQDYNIELIGGGKDGNESSIDCAIRELQEEAGIIASNLIEFGKLQLDPSTGPHIDEYFIATGLSFVERNLDHSEEIELLKVPLNQAIEWCIDGTIKNCETIAILFKVREWLKKRNSNNYSNNIGSDSSDISNDI